VSRSSFNGSPCMYVIVECIFVWKVKDSAAGKVSDILLAGDNSCLSQHSVRRGRASRPAAVSYWLFMWDFLCMLISGDFRYSAVISKTNYLHLGLSPRFKGSSSSFFFKCTTLKVEVLWYVLVKTISVKSRFVTTHWLALQTTDRRPIMTIAELCIAITKLY